MADLTVNATGTIVNDAVTNAKLANMAAGTIKGRAVGAGTGDPTDLTADQASTILDAATDPFVRTSDLPGGGGSGDVVGPASATDNAIARYNLTTGKLIQDSGITIADGATGTLSGTNTGDQDLSALQPLDSDLTAYANAADAAARRALIGAGTGNGTGDVVGPSSSTVGNVPTFDNGTGKLLGTGYATTQQSTGSTDGGKIVRLTAAGSLYGVSEAGSNGVNGVSVSGDGIRGDSDSGDGGHFASISGNGVHSIAAGAASAVLANNQSTGLALEVVQNGAAVNIARFTDGVDGMTIGPDGGLTWDDVNGAATTRVGLGLGTLATQNGTFSGTHSGTSSGVNTGDQTNITGNAATVTTNANLTGPVTSVGNATTIADAELAAIAGLTSAANKAIQFTGSGTAALVDLKLGTDIAYSGTPTYTAGAAPSGSTNHHQFYTQVGNVVTWQIMLTHATTGTTVTGLTATLPAEFPTPLIPTGFTGANAFLYACTPIRFISTPTGSMTFNVNCNLKRNAADNGFEIVGTIASGSYRTVIMSGSYFTA